MGRAGVKADRIAQDTRFDLDISVFTSEYALNERAYLEQVPEAHRKRFAQFFTPVPIAKMMAAWVLEKGPKHVLDPAVGPGVLPMVLRDIDPQVRLTLVELDPIVLQVAMLTIGSEGAEFVNTDFLSFDQDRMFDGIIANPPYLRHHDFSYSEDIFEIVGKRVSVRLSRLTNLYGIFLLEIGRRLNPGGRAAIIIPTEWTNANFGVALKRYLLDQKLLHTLVYFSHDSLPFADAQTTASVLLLEKPLNAQTQSCVRTIYLKGEISEQELVSLTQEGVVGADRILIQNVPVDVLQNAKKWDFIIKNEGLKEKRGSTHLRDYASTKRGIATGANEYFHLSISEAVESALSENSLKPCIGRAADVQGICFTMDDFNKLVVDQRRTQLVSIGEHQDASDLAYLKKGESLGLHRRYLLAARKRWYQMENRPAAPIWAAVFGRSGLRFVRNKAEVLNLTAFHCVYPKRRDELFLDALVVALNSRLAQRESAREHRVYGGGLLKVEPKDLLDMWVPPIEGFDPATLRRLADWLPILDVQMRVSGELSETSLSAIDELLEDGMSNLRISANNSMENLSLDF